MTHVVLNYLGGTMNRISTKIKLYIMKLTSSLSFQKMFFKVFNMSNVRSTLDLSVHNTTNSNQSSTNAQVDIIRSKGKEIAYSQYKYAIPEHMPQLSLNKCVSSVVDKCVTSYNQSGGLNDVLPFYNQSSGLHEVLRLSPSRIFSTSSIDFSVFITQYCELLTMSTIALGIGLPLWWAMLPDIILYSYNHVFLFDNIVVSKLIECTNCVYRTFCDLNPMSFYEGAVKCLHSNHIHDIPINILQPSKFTPIPPQVEEFVDVQAESGPSLTDRKKAQAILLGGYMLVILLYNEIYLDTIVEIFLKKN